MANLIRDIETFTSIDFVSVRAMMVNGVVAFVAHDVARALGYKRPDVAIMRHCDDAFLAKTEIEVPNRHGTTSMQEVEIKCIYEPDLYALVLSSRLPTARRFALWVRKEVLPSLRENNVAIIDPSALTPEETQRLLTVTSTVAKALEEQRPFAEIGQYLMKAGSEHTITINEIAKIISDDVHGAGPNQIRTWLCAKMYIYEENGNYLPRQWAVNNKLLTYELDKTCGHPIIKITPKGQKQIIQEFHEDRIKRDKYDSLEKYAKDNGYAVDRSGTLRDKDGFMILKEAYPGALEDAKNAMKIGSKTRIRK